VYVKREKGCSPTCFLLFVGHLIDSSFIIGTERRGDFHEEKEKAVRVLPFTGRADTLGIFCS
jgi:hypothetical protein